MRAKPSAVELQGLIDRTAVRAVVERYMLAVDRGDHDAVAGCFTADARLEYDIGPRRFTGGNELVAWFRQLPPLRAHTHTLSTCLVEVAGDEAHADSRGFAVHVVGEGWLGSIRVRGLRYVDTLVRQADGWKISRRTHTPTWQFLASSAVPALPR